MQQGSVIADKYRLIELLGRGGMGSVWLAEHTTLKTAVAVKLINSELGTLPQPRARFLREAQLAARIKSAHVVQIYDHGVTSDGQPYIAMERLVGESLRDRLLDRTSLSRAETAVIVSHVCRALTRAHEAGLVHRDLKPENIFIAREPEGEIVKVLDFGVAKATDALSDSSIDPTRTGALLGTPYYMSPEQAQGLKSVDYRTDLWAVGVVAFECLTGVRPFAAEALGPLIGKILTGPIPSPSLATGGQSPELDAWMARALARDPNARFPSAQAMSDAFMIAAGTVDSLGHDTSSRDVSLSASRGAMNRSASDANAFGDTVHSAPPDVPGALSGQTLPLSAVAANVFPVAPPVPAPAPPAPLAVTQTAQRSALPWIIAVIVLGAMVVALAVMLALRRS
jgi:serine/threonine-protein kinase